MHLLRGLPRSRHLLGDVSLQGLPRSDTTPKGVYYGESLSPKDGRDRKVRSCIILNLKHRNAT